MNQITLHGMRFNARVGILPRERTDAQPIDVDLTVHVARGAELVDYRDLYDRAAAVLAADPIDYLEQVGDRIANAALATSHRIQRVRVAVRKPDVSLPGPLEYAEVVVERAVARSPMPRAPRAHA
ncbi:MAG TPA: dihydroneopterin aldolase [Gemmatimonadaceae bacterium]|nr:dihydroneopterin aldolase [Gemmatimonadaceae bacterium]